MNGSRLIDERRAWSEGRIKAFKEVVSALPEVSAHGDLCIYVTGSFGRLEASEHSDLDLFFISGSVSGHTQMSRIDKILMDAALISECRTSKFPEFSGDGEYLEVHCLDDMRKQLGGRSDDYANLFTARLLLLLESIPIYNDSLYVGVLNQITKSYFRDYEDHVDDFRPTFLVNDILRFWKTLCLNYEHSRNSLSENVTEIRKSHLRNLKLKFSRMLTCFSLVIPLAAPRSSIGLQECVDLIRERPFERLKQIAINSHNQRLWEQLADEYSWFLNSTGRPREEVLEWIGSNANRQEALNRAGHFGDVMYDLLDAVAEAKALRYLVI